MRADLEKFLRADREGYEKFYANFGRQLGYGIVSDGGEARRDSLKEPLMFYSLHGEEAHNAQGIRFGA